MLPGLDGHLIFGELAESMVEADGGGRGASKERRAARAWMERWWRDCTAALGPASPTRAILDRAAIPLLERLGFDLASTSAPPKPGAHWLSAWLSGPGLGGLPLIVGRWSESLQSLRAGAVRHGAMPETRWCLGFNGRYAVLIDTRRAFTQAHLAFDLEVTVDHERSLALLWMLLRREAFATGERDTSLVDRLVTQSLAHRLSVCESLHRGVLRALRELVEALARVGHRHAHSPRELARLLEYALTLVYRILFMLFAEARHLVPSWHPTYRDAYTIESLRRALDGADAPVPGLWEALEAIARLADRGCSMPDLRVTPFDGRLFGARPGSPAPRLDRLDDRHAGIALTSLTTSPARDGGVRPIAYADLGVEQLGAVYERVLEYQAYAAPRTRTSTRHDLGGLELRDTSGRRKATSSYYTPRSITDYAVRCALEPLVRHASSEQILAIRILDPAVGSGAFLVSACHYLSDAYERALITEGHCASPDIDDGDRAGFRRLVAQRCLFGVDRNPMAVQLTRLSLWLTTLAADRPLTFLDHHVRTGDSLIGASLADLARRPSASGRAREAARSTALPLFDDETLAASIDQVRRQRLLLATEPGDTLRAAREKQRMLQRLDGPNSPVRRWRAAADLWCSGWFWPDASPPPRQAFPELSDHLLTGRSALPAHMRDAWLARARDAAEAHRFFHWTLEFPEVFFDATGHPRPDAGFDAVLSNPPWNMIRADAGSPAERGASREFTRRLVRFCRDSGVYRTRTTGHANAYQLFLDRSLSLLRRGGRFGMVLPGGFLIDHGTAALRRRLLDEHDVDSIVGFENRRGIFAIHRSMRFLIATGRAGGPTASLACRFRLHDPDLLDDMQASASVAGADARLVRLTPHLIERLSGPQLVIPELETPADLATTERIHANVPGLGTDEGWGARFGRELNITQDRWAFVEPGAGLPVLEGKHIEPFRAHPESVRWAVPAGAARQLLGTRASLHRARLAYRDVASATNRLTLIAAIVPAGAVTAHTLFCLKSRLAGESQWFLAGALNSYVANYLIRPQIGTHVTVAAVERLPVPKPPRDAPVFRRIVRLARLLSAPPRTRARHAHAELQALMARLYGLDVPAFERVLETLPLVPLAERHDALTTFRRLRPSLE